MKIRLANPKDKAEWLRLRKALWPKVSNKLHEQEIAEMIANPDRFAVFVASGPDKKLLGFLEVSLREDILEGCRIRQIGYIEGWYVEPDSRRSGIGRSLVQAAENWALKSGVEDMASDTEMDNLESQKAHVALGYKEADRLVLYRKRLIKNNKPPNHTLHPT